MSQMIESFMNQAAETALSARPVEFDEPGASSPGGLPLVRDGHPLRSVRVRLQVCVGQAEMTVAQLLGAKEAEVLLLDRTVEEPVDLLLEGQVVARGQLVAVDGTFGVRITELPLPLAA